MSAQQAPEANWQQPTYQPQGYGQPQQNYATPPAQGYPQTYQSPGYGPPYAQPAPYVNPPPAAPPQPPKKNGWIAPFIVLVVGVVLLGTTIGFGWYSISESYATRGDSYNGSLNTNLFYCTTTSFTMNNSTGSYSTSATTCGSGNSTHTVDLYDTALGLVIAGLAVSVLAAVTTFTRRKSDSKPLMLPFILAIVAGLLALAAPLALLIGLPGAVAADTNCGSNCQGPASSFSGSDTVSGISMTYGPGIGWYLAVVASVVLIVGAIVLMLYVRKLKASSQPRAMGNPAGYEGQPLAPYYPDQGGNYGGAAPPVAPYPQPYAQPYPQPYPQPAPAPYSVQAPVTPYPVPQVQPQGYRCTACGYVNPPGYASCLNCKQLLF